MADYCVMLPNHLKEYYHGLSNT